MVINGAVSSFALKVPKIPCYCNTIWTGGAIVGCRVMCAPYRNPTSILVYKCCVIARSEFKINTVQLFPMRNIFKPKHTDMILIRR